MKQEVNDISSAIQRLRRENKELKKRLDDERNIQPPKCSGNSSIPPLEEQMSVEVARRTKSLRKKSENTPGG